MDVIFARLTTTVHNLHYQTANLISAECNSSAFNAIEEKDEEFSHKHQNKLEHF